jgi:hypothetical protein
MFRIVVPVWVVVLLIPSATFAQVAEPIPLAPPPGVGPAPLGAPGWQPLTRKYKELIPALIEALKDVDPDVRQHSATALAGLGQEAIEPLQEALKDKSKESRAAAAYALGQMGGLARNIMPDLLKTLKDEDKDVRRSVAQAISRIVRSEHGIAGSYTPPFMPGVPAVPGVGAPQLPVPFPLPPGPPDPPVKNVPKPEKLN